MRISDDCYDCLLSRVSYECRLSSDDEELINTAVNKCTRLLNDICHEDVPYPTIASRVHRLACKIMGNSDPYYKLKQQNNQDAIHVCNLVHNNLNSFYDFALASIIGNTLDYGAKEHIVTNDFINFFREEFEKGLTIDHTDEILAKSSRVIYLCDNCGEIIFDKLLLSYLKKRGTHITLVVKNSPILNDATIADALSLKLNGISDILTTNADKIPELGLNLEIIPEVLRDEIDRCSIIFAKGMANYESLTEYTGRDFPPVAYLLSVKCNPVAKNVGVPKGSRIAMLAE